MGRSSSTTAGLTAGRSVGESGLHAPIGLIANKFVFLFSDSFFLATVENRRVSCRRAAVARDRASAARGNVLAGGKTMNVTVAKSTLLVLGLLFALFCPMTVVATNAQTGGPGIPSTAVPDIPSTALLVTPENEPRAVLGD